MKTPSSRFGMIREQSCYGNPTKFYSNAISSPVDPRLAPLIRNGLSIANVHEYRVEVRVGELDKIHVVYYIKHL